MPLKKNCIFILLLAILVILLPIESFAEDNKEPVGSVFITITAENEPVSGAVLNIYKIAEKSGDTFALSDNFREYTGNSDILNDPSAVVSLLNYIDSHNITFSEEVTDDTGSLTFKSLDDGIYLVRQSASVNGYANISPFLVQLPILEEGEYIYDIDASPKAETSKLIDITVNKLWNGGDAQERPASVEICLYDNGALLSKVTLNAENGWTYTWSSLPKNDGYEVVETEVEGYKANYSREGFVFTVTNTPSLIQTGQLTWPITAFAVSGVVLFAIGYILVFGKKKNDA